MGFQTTGTAGEYFAVDGSKVTPIPSEMTWSEGAMMEPTAVAVHAAKQFPAIKGAKAVVLGCGPIGILVAQAAKALGAEKVMVTDISDNGWIGPDHPKNATVEWGTDMLDACAKYIADFMEAFRRAPLPERK